MSETTQILEAIDAGDAGAVSQLLPLVYDELRKLAAAEMAKENPGQTLQPTALVHEAMIRLIGAQAHGRQWSGKTHFYSAAAESMRLILIDAARKRHALKRGRDYHRDAADPDELVGSTPDDDMLALNEALEALGQHAPLKAELVKLRYFAGCTLPEAAKLLGISPREADRAWAYAKAWLRVKLGKD